MFEPVSARDECALRMFFAFRDRGRIEKAQQCGVQFGARVSVAALGQEEARGDGRAVDTRQKSIFLVVDEREPLWVFVQRASIGELQQSGELP